jgi:hypothetical protein
MSRRRPQESDSLELLLDTLCNTFGGVLFIAMLVVVLLQMAGSNPTRDKPRDPVRSEDLVDLADELEVLMRERESLTRDVPNAREESARDAVDTSNARARLAESLERLDELRRRKDKTLVETGRHDAGALAIDEQLADLDKNLAQTDREAQELREQIEKEQKANARIIHTPLMHPTNKQNLVVELRYDRLYFVHEMSPSGERLGPNLDEYVLLDASGDEIQVTANPNRGFVVGRGAEFISALRRRLARFPPDRWFLDLAVRSDSFGSFHALMEAARAARYEIRVLLVPERESFQDRGGTREDVQ